MAPMFISPCPTPPPPHRRAGPEQQLLHASLVGVSTRKCSECTTSATKHERVARWYVRCTRDGGRSADGRRHVSDVPRIGIRGASRLRPSHTTVRTGPY